MNKTCWMWLILSPPLCAEHYRDPFQPPPVTSCIRSAVLPEGWRLQGTIGTPEKRYAWVVTPQGQWLGLLPQQRLLEGLWQVVKIQPGQLELAVQEKDEMCSSFINSAVLTLGKPS